MGLNKTLECEVALTFRQQNLTAQYEPLLADCNLYVVTRRPRTYITPGSVRINRRGLLTGKVTVEFSGKRWSRRLKMPFRLTGDSRLAWREDMPRDYYQIVEKGSGRLAYHGDPWSLAFLSSGLLPELAAHEVIYVGQSVGKKQQRNSLDRIIAHRKIQQIYADHSGQDYDIFINPLRIVGSSSIFELATSADFSMSQYVAELTARSFSSNRSIYSESVSLCEAALISYFKPEYNRQHNNNFPHKPTKISEMLTRYRYSNLTVILSDGNTGIQLWSTVRKPGRFHHAGYRLPRPDDLTIEEFDDSATRTENSQKKILTDLASLTNLGSVTLAFIPVDTPNRIKINPNSYSQ
jgi:hypothetical protein